MKERKLLPSDSPNLLDRVAQRSFGEATHFPNVGSLQMKVESYIPKTHQADVGKKRRPRDLALAFGSSFHFSGGED